MTSVAYGIAMPASRGILTPPIFCAQAAAFFGRLAAQPASPRKVCYNTLIASLVSAGVWAKLDALYIFAAADQATALTNLVQSSYAATAVNSPTFTADSGFAFAVSKYVDSGFNPSLGTGVYQQNSASVGAWGSLAATENAALLTANGASSESGGVEILPRWGAGTFYAHINSFAEDSIASADGSGMYTLSRVNSTGYSAYRNGAAFLTPTATSQTPINNTILFGNVRAGNAAYGGTIYSGHIGAGLTAQNASDLYNALHAYLQAVAGVP